MLSIHDEQITRPLGSRRSPLVHVTSVHDREPPSRLYAADLLPLISGAPVPFQAETNVTARDGNQNLSALPNVRSGSWLCGTLERCIWTQDWSAEHPSGAQ